MNDESCYVLASDNASLFRSRYFNRTTFYSFICFRSERNFLIKFTRSSAERIVREKATKMILILLLLYLANNSLGVTGRFCRNSDRYNLR